MTTETIAWTAAIAGRLIVLLGWGLVTWSLWAASRFNGPLLRAFAWVATANTWSVFYFVVANYLGSGAMTRGWSLVVWVPLGAALIHMLLTVRRIR